jgi:glycosyltransferase involved in cell wall biosynthesis
MRIGFISQALPYLPSRGGFRLYGGNLLRCLSRRHQIDLISLLEDDDEKHLDWQAQYCASVSTIRAKGSSLPMRVADFLSSYARGKPLHYREQLGSMLRAGLRAHQWHVLHIEGGFVGALVPADLPVAKVLSLHDSWTLRFDEMLRCSQNVRDKAYNMLGKFCEPRQERLVYPRFERCTVVAAPDLEEVRRTVPKAKVDLIPYGTDTEYFHPLPVQKQGAVLVFHSHLGYAPNIEAALEFADAIFPLILREVPAATFHLVGANPGPKVQALASRTGIKLSANLPDLRSAVCSAQVYVCAIRHGTGLKSKMLEAMAMRMPIVAYHPGSTVGIDCVYGKHLLAAETPQEFAAHVVELLRHPEIADQMAQAARELVEQKYSWESRARAYEELYERVIQERRAATNRNGGRF